MNKLITVQAAIDLITAGASLSLAGPESALDQLPAGNWIGGTIPYFMVASGGVVVNEGKVFATNLSSLGDISIASYEPDQLADISGHAPDNGFSIAIIPAGSRSHQKFASEAANFEDAFLKPTVGWISGVHLSQLGTVTPKVYDGRTATKYEDRAVVAYVKLPEDKLASLEIVNLFEPGNGDVLHFDQTSFEVSTCKVNGTPVNFADYIRSKGLENGALPLVGDFAGAYVNVSLQNVGDTGGKVTLYAPVFPGVDYKFAKPVGDYAAAFRERLASVDNNGVVLSCNCILNFLFGELEGKAIGGVEGPITFGEIAYQLLNQTMVMVRLQ
jgi:hypothetical protein